MNNKIEILNKIRENSPVFYTVTSEEFRIRCPLCGDSQKNFKSAHMYLKCSKDLSEPIMFHCFKCNKNGRMNNEFLNLLNIKNITIDDNNIVNKLYYFKNHNLNIDNCLLKTSIDYIKYRIGDISENELMNLRLISLDELSKILTNKRIINSLPFDSECIAFISEDNSMVICRYLYNENYRWKKIQLFNSGVSVYTIKTMIDLFTLNDFNIHISEGIFDCISCYKNFDKNNSLCLAVLGSNYSNGIEYCINKGIVGSNININIYLDQDINEREVKKNCRIYKWLFKDIRFYKNSLDHDLGVKPDRIQLIEV